MGEGDAVDDEPSAGRAGRWSTRVRSAAMTVAWLAGIAALGGVLVALTVAGTRDVGFGWAAWLLAAAGLAARLLNRLARLPTGSLAHGSGATDRSPRR